MCKNGHSCRRIGAYVSDNTRAALCCVQKRTLMRANYRLRVRKYARTDMACAETDTPASERSPSCPEIRAHGSGVCKNRHRTTGLLASAFARKRRIAPRRSSTSDCSPTTEMVLGLITKRRRKRHRARLHSAPTPPPRRPAWPRRWSPRGPCPTENRPMRISCHAHCTCGSPGRTASPRPRRSAALR